MLTLKIGKNGEECQLQSGQRDPKIVYEGSLEGAVQAARRRVIDLPGAVLTLQDPFNVIHLFDEEQRAGLPYGVASLPYIAVRRLSWNIVGN